MRGLLLIAAVLALAVSPVSIVSTANVATAKAAQCKDPKTGKFIKCPPATSSAPPAVTSAAHPPHCTKGVPCGNTCIAKGKVCHKT